MNLPSALTVPSSSYAAVGGGATPFNPSWDFSMVNSGGLIGACMRHVKRTRRKHQRRRQSADADGAAMLRDQPAQFALDGGDRAGKLYCRTGFHMQIHHNGKVNGTRRDNSPFGVLEFLSIAFGLVSIRGKETNRFLCMNKKGKLYGSLKHSPECIFMERMLENYYNTYTSCKYSRKNKKWFVALNKRGRPRKGNRSKKKQKFSQFLVLHLDNEQAHKRRNFFKTQLGVNSFALKWRRDQQQSTLLRVLNSPEARRRLDLAIKAPQASSGRKRIDLVDADDSKRARGA